jgi:hypothetical protein
MLVGAWYLCYSHLSAPVAAFLLTVMNLSHHTRSPAALSNDPVSKLILRSQRTSKESTKILQVLNYQVSVASEIVRWRAVIIYIRISVNLNIWHKPEYRIRCSDWTAWGSKPGIGERCVSSRRRPDRLWDQPNLLFSVYRSSFPEAGAYNKPFPFKQNGGQEWLELYLQPVYVLSWHW